MSLENLPTRWAGAVSLLALVPAIWYTVGRPSTAGIVAAVNVVIIFAALYVATQPVVGEEHAHDSGGGDGGKHHAGDEATA